MQLFTAKEYVIASLSPKKWSVKIMQTEGSKYLTENCDWMIDIFNLYWDQENGVQGLW